MDPTSRPRIPPHTWALPVLAATVLPLAVLLAAGATLSWRDTARLFEPLRPLVVDALRHGRLPLWSPHDALGLPLFAQLMHGVLQPVSVIAALLAPGAGMDLFIVVYVAVAGLGAAWLARELGASAGAAVVAGVAFGLSGYVLSMSAVLLYVSAAGFAPWCVGALRRSGRGGPGILAAAVATAVSWLAGDPQWTMVAVALGLALAAEAGGWRGAARAVGAIGLGSALAAVQLVPSAAYAQRSLRGVLAFSEEERAFWSLVPARLVELVAPGFFGGRPGETVAAPVFQALAVEHGARIYSLPFVPSVFVGGTLVVLAIAGTGASRAARVLGASAAILLWTALGTSAGAEQLLRHVPVWGSFRYPEKVIGPFTLCVAVLGALGVDAWAARRAARGWAPSLGALAGGVALAAAALALRPGVIADRLSVGLWHAAAALGATALVALAARRPSWPAARLPWVVTGIVFLESVAALPFAVHLGVRGAAAPPLVREWATPQPLEPIRIGVPLRGAGAIAPPGLDGMDGKTALESRMGSPEFNCAAGIDQIETYTGIPPYQLVLAESVIRRDWIVRRRYGLTHLVLRRPADAREAELMVSALAGATRVGASEEWGVSAWAVPHRPWASFAARVVAVGSSRDASAALQGIVARGGDDVVVEGPPPHGLAAGRVLGIERQPEFIRVEAEAAGDALLVVNDAYWPGWEARVDGAPVEVLRADLLVRAIPWPPGRHVLEMRYRPTEVLLGVGISSAAAALLVALAIVPAVRRRRSRES